MYRYAATKNRVHRVIVEGGKAFKVEQCNLDDTAFLHLDDIAPEGKRCAYCWAGWVEPTEEAKAAHAEEIEKFKEASTGSVPIVQSTRRMALAALVGAALLGSALGVVASPDMETAAALDPTGQLDEMGQRIEDLNSHFNELLLRIEVLQTDLHDHEQSGDAHGTSAPPVIIIPGLPTAVPAPTASPAPQPTASSGTGRSGSTGSDTHTTTIIVVPAPTQRPGSDDPTPRPTPQPTPQPTAAPTPPPTPAPTPTPCARPGEAKGAGDPCRWPNN